MYRMVNDFRAITLIMAIDMTIVPNQHTLSTIPHSTTHFTVIDLANDCQYLFAFTFDHKPYWWTVPPQGAANYPSQYNAALQGVLQGWAAIHPETLLLKYVDDFCYSSSPQCAGESHDRSCK